MGERKNVLLMKKAIFIAILIITLVFPIKKVSAADYSNVWNVFLDSSDNYNANSITPDDGDEFTSFVELPISEQLRDYNNIYRIQVSNCSADFSSCDFTLYESNSEVDSKAVNIVYKTVDSSIIDKYDDYANDMRNSLSDIRVLGINVTSSRLFNITDLKLYAKNSSAASIYGGYPYNLMEYSDEIESLYSDQNLSIQFIPRKGDGMDFYIYDQGTLNYLYNGIIISSVNRICVVYSNVIYIPKNTEKSSDAYISAAKKRIKDELGLDATIELGGTRASYSFIPFGDFSTADELFASFGTEEELGNYWYNVTFNAGIKKYLIVANIDEPNTPAASDPVNNSSSNSGESINQSNGVDSISNPPTGDNVIANCILLIISSTALLLMVIIEKNKITDK